MIVTSTFGRFIFPTKSALLFRLYSSYPPHVVIRMPALSPTMTQGNLVSWRKKIGEEVSAGQVIAEVETDKAQIDFECQEEGYMAKYLVEEGSKDIPIGVPVAVFAENKEDVGKFVGFDAKDAGAVSAANSVPGSAPAPSSVPAPSSAPAPAPTSSPAPVVQQATSAAADSRIKASPFAKTLARESGVELSGITGTGPNNRIIGADVKNAAASNSQVKATTSSQSKSAAPQYQAISTASYTDFPLSNMRKVIANRLSESKSTIPHYYLTIEVKMDNIIALRKQFNDQQKNGTSSSFKLSVNDFIIKAAALALRAQPEVNSSWNKDFIRQYNNVDISVAVSTPTGLITPIVFNADTKGLATISNTVKELANRAKEGKLLPQEFQGGTFTISNLGMFGIKHFTAIINPPQSAILAIGQTESKVIAKDEENEYTRVNVMQATLSCDHRVIDGALGAQWLSKFKEFMENPTNMLL